MDTEMKIKKVREQVRAFERQAKRRLLEALTWRNWKRYLVKWNETEYCWKWGNF